jgi:acylphosphatase
MKTVVIHVTGRVQKVGYRAKIVAFAEYLGIKGYIKNLPDNGVEIAGQGSEAALKTFIDGAKIQDKLIKVETLEYRYFDTPQDYTDFDKIVGPNETDARLDDGIEHLEKISNLLEKMNENMQEGFNKMDQNHTELVTEVRGLREDNSERIMNEIKEAVTNEVHIMQEELMNKIQKIENIFKDSIKQS